MPRSTSASTAVSADRATCSLRAASPIAPMKQADQPAANSCSGLVPPPGVPGDDSLTSRRPSELREAPSRQPLVRVLLVTVLSRSGLLAGFGSSAQCLPWHGACGLRASDKRAICDWPGAAGTRVAERPSLSPTPDRSLEAPPRWARRWRRKEGAGDISSPAAMLRTDHEGGA